MIIVNNFKIIIIPNGNLDPLYPIVVAQAKPQPKDQMRVAPPFEANRYMQAQTCMPYMRHDKEAVAYTNALHEALQEASSTHTCLTHNALPEALQNSVQLPSMADVTLINAASITLLAYCPAFLCSTNRFSIWFSVASINSD